MKHILLLFIFTVVIAANSKAEPQQQASTLYSTFTFEECTKRFIPYGKTEGCEKTFDGANEYVFTKSDKWNDPSRRRDSWAPQDARVDAFASYSSFPCGSSISLKQNDKWVEVDQKSFCTKVTESTPFYILEGGCC